MVTVRQTWIGLVILLFVTLLVLAAAVYWQHVAGVNYLHVMASIWQPDLVTHGC